MTDFIENKVDREPTLVCGIAINDADYVTQVERTVNGDRTNIKICPFYSKWAKMIVRVYSKRYKEKRPSYQEATVCEDWLTFSIFKAWMQTQNWQGNQLDKDLLVQGNKHYSPETCIFVTQEVNSFIIESTAARGDLPIGVSIKDGKFSAQITNRRNSERKRRHLGLFNTPEEAHNAWLKAKLDLARKLAAKQTDSRVADALIYRYENYQQGE